MKEAAKYHKYYTKEGKPITFKWHHIDPRKKNRFTKKGWNNTGYTIHKLDALVDNKVVGYLAISYIPYVMAKKLFPTVWHWLIINQNKGSKKWLKNTNNRDLLYSSLIKYSPIHSWADWEPLRKKIESIPLMSSKEYLKYAKQREKDLFKIKKYFTNKRYEYNDFLTEVVDVPQVDFINVEPEYQRQGIALALYQEGARRMAEKGMSLYSGFSQQPGAEKAWKKMETIKSIPFKKDDKYRNRLDYASRYRKKKATSLPPHFYQTKDGRKITFRWFDKDPDSRSYPEDERGWIVHKLVAFVDRKQAGYLMISYIPKRAWDTLYPTILHFLLTPFQREFNLNAKRWLKNPKDLDFLVLGLENPKIHNYLYYLEDWKKEKNLKKLSPEEYGKWKDFRDAILKREIRDKKGKYKQMYRFYVDKPLVDYIRVKPEFQRQGVGLALYQMGARIMAKKGLPLYASGIQSPEAKGAWKKMKSLKKIPLKQEGKRTKIEYL